MSLMDEPGEMLDLVNDRDEVISAIVREDVMQLVAGSPGFVRAANVFIMNDQEELWVPRRASWKKIAPNGLDFSAGEHVQSGETYEAAALRGCQEELGLTVTPSDLAYVGKITPSQSGVPYFESLFIYHANQVPQYKKTDFVGFEWLKAAALRERLQAGEPAKKGLMPSLKLLLLYKVKDKP